MAQGSAAAPAAAQWFALPAEMDSKCSCSAEFTRDIHHHNAAVLRECRCRLSCVSQLLAPPLRHPLWSCLWWCLNTFGKALTIICKLTHFA